MNKKSITIILISTLIFIFALLVIKKILQLSKQDENTLTICTFSDIVGPELINKFEKKFNAKIKVKYCDSDAEFWSQLYINKGKGFDIVTPADYVVDNLVKFDLLQKIHPFFRKKANAENSMVFSEKNSDYKIPFAWTFYGIIYNKLYFEKYNSNLNSWSFIFQPEIPISMSKISDNYKVVILEDNPQDIIFLAHLYLFKNVSGINSKYNQNAVKKLLQIQRKYLYAYILSDIDYYLDGIAPAGLTVVNSQVRKTVLKKSKKMHFTIPSEGTVYFSQNFCIPKGAENVKLAYKFIDFCMKEEGMKSIFHHSGYLPVNYEMAKNVCFNIMHSSLWPNKVQTKKMFPITSKLSYKDAEDIWTQVKAYES